MSLRLSLAVLVASLLLAQAAEARRGKAPRRCSGTGVAVRTVAQLRAPEPVRRMHRAILTAAHTCDYEGLARLGRQGRPGFSFSFGKETDAARFWRQREESGDGVMARLIQVLKLDFRKDGGTYVWPAAFARDATDEDWAALEPVFGRTAVRLQRSHTGYTAMRVGIAADGDLLYCVEGD